MRDLLGPNTLLGYCTNVHAGASYEHTLANLQRYALAVKQRISPEAPMGVGLWLSAQAARALIEEERLPALRDWLGEQGLNVFTLNGFPYGDFHEPRVKERVYEPDWRQPERSAYTRDLIQILAALLPEGGEGSISTLPLGWRPALMDDPDVMQTTAARLLEMVHHLARVELDTGRYIHLNLEPEPGCVLDTSDDVVAFFEQHLLGGRDDVSTRAYLRVCHDICHAAVMFEDQAQALQRYRAAGIGVGKVQIASAIRVPLGQMSVAEWQTALKELRAFSEDRYLHQVVVCRPSPAAGAQLPGAQLPGAAGLRGGAVSCTFYADLAEALDAEAAMSVDTAGGPGEFRAHFHVPIFLERFGLIETTQDQIAACLRAIEPGDAIHHFEVETYAWDVLPAALRTADLSAGIAEELQWVRHLTANGGRP